MKERQQQALLEAEVKRVAREKRDKEVWELQNVNPDKAWEPHNKEIHNQVKGLRSEVTEMAMLSPDGPISNEKKGYIKDRWDEINLQAAKSMHYKELYHKAQKDIESNPFQKDRLKDYYLPKLTDIFFDEFHSPRPMADIADAEDQINAVVGDGGGYDLQKRAKEMVGNPAETISSKVKLWKDANGVSHSDDYKVQHSHFYTPDFDDPSGIKKDANGQDVINISQDAIDMFVDGDPMVKQKVMMEAEERGIAPVEVIKDHLTKAAREQKAGGLDITPHERSDSEWLKNMFGGRLKPDEVPVANKAFEQIGHLSSAFVDENGNRTTMASPQARAAAGHFKGTKQFGGIVEEVELVPGTNKPGTSKIFDGRTIENSPNDRMVLKVKTGSAGRINLEPVDLIDEGAPSTMWNMLKEGGYMGKKNIAFDQAAEELGVDTGGLYRGRENIAKNQLAEQATVNEWIQGQNYGGMTSGTYKGQPITKVVPNTGLTGKFQGGYKLTLGNGKTVDIAKDDYDALTDIQRSISAPPAKQAAPATVVPKGNVKVKDPNGKVGYIPADQLKDALEQGYKKAD